MMEYIDEKRPKRKGDCKTGSKILEELTNNLSPKVAMEEF